MIVAICGGANVGTSTVALNLGRELEAVVVDGDLAFAERCRVRGPDLQDLLAGRATALEAVAADGPVSVLPCGRPLGDVEAHDGAPLGSALEDVDREFGHVVVDCPAGNGAGVIAALRAADAAVIVTTASNAALVAAARTKRVALETETPIAGVVRNRSSASRPPIDGRRRALERGLGEPVIVLREMTTVRVAGQTGRPVRDVAPDSDAVDRFASLAASIEGEGGRVRATVS